ncbi:MULTISPECIES: carbon-nitrogen hydrolase family protein [unclassified Rhodococcus (in: high G+C Gram-positive bacteria)]|uniref:carbon-nitrogen hydrolase family protein n=1 Tax=unclassified Rhodococcus (in: high G+C Gram-positive bacteria) TaxID=192944 RepID=UPI0016399CA8|nr:MULTISPECIES: carbon-nitrogen hydrolase family protein [unclassified Rhodococcus (in: high G+C Gram-positive bacteria)]MBC2642626.1 carbon-nitrogen hydrolase family protein [Rhodococcus sp. 3A]MBC2892632.1 carbon-nitrogen hydrolase family protein [Rhodococcus sp. 4CII]
MDTFPRFTAAAVQASPVYLDPAATVDKAVGLIHEAAAAGAALIAFPEVFVPGYPYWNWTMNPVKGGEWFERLYKAAIDIPGPHLDTLRAAAAATKTTVVIGVNERGRHSLGVLYNSVVTIGPDGSVIAVHRKLVPTWAEKLTWTNGDGSTLRVHQTEVGPLGVLACGENTNTLARFALLAQGELVHVANYISLPVAPKDYDMADAIAIRTAAHAFEGKLFSVVSCSTVSQEIIDLVAGDDEEAAQMLRRERSALSGIFGPDGRPVSEPLVDKEGIVYGEIDLSRCIAPKQMHDIIGHYNRFDIFSLNVNTAPLQPLTFNGAGGLPPEPEGVLIGPWGEDEIPGR